MVKIRIIAEEVSNKYGASYEEMQSHGYRGGIAFKAVMEDGDKKMYFVLAQGEFLNSFPLGMNLGVVGGTYYVRFFENHGYESSCGWRTWRDPYIFPAETEEAEEVEELPMNHQVLFWELFNKKKLELYSEFIKRFDLKNYVIDVIPEQDRYLLPLLYTFVRGRRVEKGELDLIEEEYSFKTNIEVKWRGKNIMIPFYISKTKNYDVYIDYSTRIITVYSGNLRKINIIDQGGERLVVYLRHLRQGDEDIRGWELDGELEQPLCRIPSSVEIDDLINRRLGDVFFIEEQRARVSYRVLTSLGRLEVLKGKYEFNDEKNRILIESDTDEKIIVYHPEHGILTLPAGRYVLFSVPYIGRRED